MKVVKPTGAAKRLVKVVHELMRPSMHFLKKANVTCGSKDDPSKVSSYACVRTVQHLMANKARFGNQAFVLLDHCILLGRLARAASMVQKYGIGTVAADLESIRSGVFRLGVIALDF